MLNIKTKILTSVACAGAFFMLTFHDAYAATSSQALEQLQMLQRKMMVQRSSKNPVKPDSNAKKTETITKVKKNKSLSQNNASVKKKQKEDLPTVSEADAMREVAFDDVTQKLFPLTTEEVLRVHQKYRTSEFALAATPGTPPRPAATTQIVNLSPGSTPPVIRLAQGFVSSVVFLDSTGAPWPIVAYDLGDPSSFNIQWDKSGNTLMMQANKLYNYGNMAVKLQGLNTPVMLTLVPGQKAIDYRVDMRVQGYGPNAKRLPTGVGLPPSADSTLLKVLDGVPPAGSNSLVVKGGPAKAWVIGQKMFVRTGLTILSPGWISTMTSADGTHAYEMIKAPVLLVSWHGKVMQLKLEGL